MPILKYDAVPSWQKKGTAAPSYVSNLLNADEYAPDQDYTIKTSAASALAGGTDTVRILPFIHHPPTNSTRLSDHRTTERLLPLDAPMARQAEESTGRNRPSCW